MKRRSVTRAVAHLLWLVSIALGGACVRNESGTVRVVAMLSAADVTSARLTIGGAGISPPIVVAMTRSGDQWSAVVANIPTGTDRTFLVEAFDASGTLRYSGQATGVTVTADPAVIVAITAQQVDPPATSNNSAPIIDAIVVSSSAIAPGETITISSQAHDPDVGDTLAYAWSASGGTFSSTTEPATSWTAPASSGTYVLTLAASDPHGETAQVSFNVAVNAITDGGSASVTVTLNTWPTIADLSSAPDRLAAAGSTTALDVSASDADGDALGFAWSASCSGAFTSTAVQSPTFTLSALPAGNACTFSVTITDGRGGTNTGSLTLPTGPDPIAHQAPRIVVATQSATTAGAGGTVDLHVEAMDPEGAAMTFSWSASAGALGAPTTGASASSVVWTAPTPFSTSAHLQVVVTDANGASTTQGFDVLTGSISLTIQADSPGTWNQWIDTGVDLAPGQVVAIAASGAASSCCISSGPDGLNSSPNQTESLVNTVRSQALVGMIDSPAGGIPTAPTFTTSGMYLLDAGVGSGLTGPGFVGSSFTQTIPVGVAGRLYLGFNDGFDADNTGSYAVTITVN